MEIDRFYRKFDIVVGEDEMKNKKFIKGMLIAFGVVVGILAVSSIVSELVTNYKHNKSLKQDSLSYISDKLLSAEKLEDYNSLYVEANAELFTTKYQNELEDEQAEWLKAELMGVNKESDNVYVDMLGEYKYNLAKVWDFQLKDSLDEYVSTIVSILGKEEYWNTTIKVYDSKGSTLEMYRHEDENLYANVMLTFMSKDEFAEKYSDLGIEIVRADKRLKCDMGYLVSLMKDSNTVYHTLMDTIKLHNITTNSNKKVDMIECFFVSDNTENDTLLEAGYDDYTWINFTLGPREVKIIKNIYANVSSQVEELEFIRFLYEREITSYDILGNIEDVLDVYGAELH